jgi:hypothetical protein
MNEDFLEKILLLLVAGALTGLLVPELAARVAESRYRRQKVFEAELQRQTHILSAQAELLRSLARSLWELQLLNIDVSFNKLNGSEDSYQRSCDKYLSRVAELLGQIRVEISASKRLVSPVMQERLSDLYFGTLLRVDSTLVQLIREGVDAPVQAWRAQHEASFGTAQEEIDKVLTELAVELKLAAPATLVR